MFGLLLKFGGLQLLVADVGGSAVEDTDDAVAGPHAIAALPYCWRIEQLRGEDGDVERVGEVGQQRGGGRV